MNVEFWDAWESWIPFAEEYAIRDQLQRPSYTHSGLRFGLYPIGLTPFVGPMTSRQVGGCCWWFQFGPRIMVGSFTKLTFVARVSQPLSNRQLLKQWHNCLNLVETCCLGRWGGGEKTFEFYVDKIPSDLGVGLQCAGAMYRSNRISPRTGIRLDRQTLLVKHILSPYGISVLKDQ